MFIVHTARVMEKGQGIGNTRDENPAKNGEL
jgi:hypothetical protein